MIDIHVHFFPPAVFRAIWRFFETRSSGLWNIRYRLHTDDHIRMLKDRGVRHFTTLVYAHKREMAAFLNDFVAEWSQREAAIIPFGTIFAGDGNVINAARDIFEQRGFYGIKAHPFVSGEELDDPRFFPAYELMQSGGRILVCHPGSGPVYDRTDGARRLRRVLKEFPKLKVVVAHCGAFEYRDYPLLADEFEHVYFDTAMNCVHTHVFHNNCPGPAFFQRYQDRILYGSDFPNIPYDYAEQKEAILNMQLGERIEQNVFQNNARRLLGWAVE
ncbi:MAG: amidohydrolase family protein [Leptospiraceae bacterium]|nr:amidohydrolase family protein [Leptospiraceae bacterium]